MFSEYTSISGRNISKAGFDSRLGQSRNQERSRVKEGFVKDIVPLTAERRVDR